MAFCPFSRSRPCPSPHKCLRMERLLSGEKEFLRGTGNHRAIHLTCLRLRAPFSEASGPTGTGKGWSVCGVFGVKGTGAGREAQRGGFDPPAGSSVSPENATWLSRTQKLASQRTSSATNLLCPPCSPCPSGPPLPVK